MPALAVFGFRVLSGNCADDEDDQIIAAPKMEQHAEIWRILLLLNFTFPPRQPVRPPEFSS
jgi:hypothetical protein